MRILLNFEAEARAVPLEPGRLWSVALSTHAGRTGAREKDTLRLAPNEGVLLLPISA